MKRLLIVFSILIGLVLVLVATKPSKQRCKEEFKRTLITLTSTDFVKYQDENEMKVKNVEVQKPMDMVEEGTSDKFSKEHWENYYSYKDCVIFCIIKFEGLSLHKKVGFGILNSTFEL
jgi:hypothetical protein